MFAEQLRVLKGSNQIQGDLKIIVILHTHTHLLLLLLLLPQKTLQISLTINSTDFLLVGSWSVPGFLQTFKMNRQHW